MTLVVRLLFDSGEVMKAWQADGQTAAEFRAMVEQVGAEAARECPDAPPPLIEREWE